MSAEMKTYSFKAPRDWEARLERARKALTQFVDLERPDGARLLHELDLAIVRQPGRLTRASNQSDLMRAMVELLLAAVEKVERDRQVGEAYAAAAADRSLDESEFTRAATRAAASRARRGL